MGLVIFLGIVFLAVVIFVQYKVSKLFEKIAFDKGYDENAHAFAMCFCLGFVGYIYVASMPKLTTDEIKKNTTDEIKKNTTDEIKKNTKQYQSTNVMVDDFNVDDFNKANEIYNKATKKMVEGNENNSIEFYKEAIDLFKTIPNHKNTNDLVSYCEKRIQELEK